jgi:ABC-type transport system involved in multi-copper enzyme maturation permease subunit
MFLSLLYLSLFIGMSLLVSTLAKSSSTSLLLLLFIVIVLVFVVPNMAGITAGKLVHTLGDYEARARSDAIGEEYRETMTDLNGRIRNGTLQEPDEIVKLWREPYRHMIEERKQVTKEYERGLVRKQGMAETLARISPSTVFQSAAEAVVNSGSNLQSRLQKAAQGYQQIYLNYVESKVGEIIPQWQPGRTIHLPDKTRVEIPEIKPKTYDGDMSDFPSFTYPQPSARERLDDALLDITLLLLWNIACFLLAHLIFLRQDIY